MNEPVYTLGIDLGTSSCKVAIVDPAGKIIDSDTESYPLYLTPNGGAEQNPEDWWNAIVKATARMVERSRIPKDMIKGIGVTGQFSGVVPVGKDSQPLRRSIIWMDTRGEPYIREIAKGTINLGGYRIDKLRTWISRTGGAPAHSGKDSISHVLFLKNEEPDLYRDTFKFLEPKDYINLKLTGTFFGSYDSIVLYWVTDNRDLGNVKYDGKLLKLATIDGDKLPDLRPSTEVIAGLSSSAAEELMLNKGVKVVAGAGDMQSSLIGSGSTLDFQANIYLGTSSWLTAHVPFKKTDLFHNIASLPSSIPNKYFVAAEQESAGISLEHIRKILYCVDSTNCTDKLPSFSAMDAIAENSPPGSEGVIFLPWLYGERAPVENKYVRGAFYNFSLQTDRASMIRSVLEGVAFNTRWLLNPVEHLLGRKADPIRVAGGGALSPLWCEILSNVLDRTMQVVENPVFANSRGAALLASVSLGITDFNKISESVPIVNEFRPSKHSAKIYDGIFKHFTDFYYNNRKSFQALNREK